MEVIDDNKSSMSPFSRQMLAVSGVTVYMIGTGANIAFPGVLLEQLRKPGSGVTLTPTSESWIASILGLALISGIITSPYCLHKFGRKFTNQLSTLPALIGWALMVIAKDPSVIIISRIMQGFAMGLEAPACSVTIAEYSAPKYRGTFLATIAFSFATGILIAHVFGTILYWRQAALACGSVYAISLILLTMAPETPPYLASKGLYKQCRQSFRWLRGYGPNSEKELEILINSQKNRVIDSKTESRLEFCLNVLKKPEFYKPTIIMMVMFIMFQASGMTVIPSYTVMIMETITGGELDEYFSMILVDFVRFLSALIAFVVVNKCNRRSVLFFGVTVTSTSLVITSLIIHHRENSPELYKWTPVLPFLAYIFGQTIGILSIPWAVAGEVFPLAYRSLGGGISGSILSAMFFLVVKTAPKCFSTIGIDGTLMLYAAIVSVCGVFLYFLFPETRGKTLYEIECYFKGKADVIQDTEEKVGMIPE